MKSLTFEITDQNGLHLTPAHKLVETIHTIKDSNLELYTTALPTRIFFHNSNVALSIMALITAGITTGSTMIVNITDSTLVQEELIEKRLASLSFWKQKT